MEANNVALEVSKQVAKHVILAKLKIPILIFLILGLLGGGLIALMVSVVSFVSEEEISLGGWEIGEITEFGANEIPAEYIPVYKEAAEKYGVPWNLLAAHHRVETRFSTISPMISPVGAIGHMQFMPLTWIGWSYPGGTRLGDASIPNDILTDPAKIKQYGGYGIDGDGDGKADPMNLADAVHSAAKYLAANGAADGNLRKAVFAYNHSDKYVNDVLGFADLYVKGYAAIEVGKAITIDGMAWPVPGTLTITSRFGTRIDPITGLSASHSGLDIAGAGVNGKPVVSMLDGKVTSAGSIGALGNAVIISHDNGIQTTYGHLSAIKVKIGDTVKAGSQIGNVGSTGRSTGPHLHFMVRVSGQLVDPEKYLSKFKFKPI